MGRACRPTPRGRRCTGARGPWGSLIPGVASHPSQLYEGFAALLVLQLMTIAAARGAFRAADGSALLVGIAGWAVIRVIVATTWRDASVLGPLLAEQLIALSVAAVCVLMVVSRGRRRRGAEAEANAARAAAASPNRRAGARSAHARHRTESPV